MICFAFFGNVNFYYFSITWDSGELGEESLHETAESGDNGSSLKMSNNRIEIYVKHM